MSEKNSISLSKEMKKFYLDRVVVRKSVIDDLREKKKINIERFRKGVDDYNEENNTDYKILEEFEQGSVAMSTLIQSESNDYDIDVAIVFEKEKFNIGCISAKNLFINCLNKRTSNFNKEPEIKTNCIRVYYENGYHLDFALFRNNGDIYEHCGSEWRERNPRDINNWFRKQNDKNNNKLRIFTRLLKAFCKSHESWIMPGGLMNTILVSEALNEVTINSELDKDFISILIYIKNRLEKNKEILNPINNESLMLVKEDYTKTENLCNRLTEQLSKYEELQAKNSSKNEYINFWKNFFCNDYWNEDELNNNASDNFEYDEIFIENFYKLASTIDSVEIKCYKITKQFATDARRKLAASYHKRINVKKRESFVFYVDNQKYNSPEFYIIWKIKNNGEEAEINNCIRGDFYLSNHIEGVLIDQE